MDKQNFLADVAGTRLDVFLTSQTGKSRAYIQEQIEAGNVHVAGKTCTKPSQKLKAGESISIHFTETKAVSLKPVDFPLEILFEDEFLLAINKPQGVVTHPAPGFKGPTLVHYLLSHLSKLKHFTEHSDERPGIVHRLDKGTSGVILIAKDREIQEALSAQFKNRSIKKEYEAIAWGKMFLEGKANSPIGRDRKNRQKMSSKSEKTRSALTHWKVKTLYQHFSHVELFPHTGRTHQLRVHLTEKGHSIVGDEMYGGSNKQKRYPKMNAEISKFLEPITETFLHAKQLTFTHPKSEKLITLVAPRPERFENFLTLLEKLDV